MADHDPLCPMVVLGEHPICLCDHITAARADERQRIAQAIDSFLVRFDPKGPAYWPVSEAARIARNGGSDD